MGLVEGQRVAVDVADGQKGARGGGLAADLSTGQSLSADGRGLPEHRFRNL